MAATISVKPQKPRTGGGRRGPIDRHDFGGGGGNGGGRGDSLPDYGERLRRYRLGLALALIAIVLLFVSLTGTFLLRQGLGAWNETEGAYVHDWNPVKLPMALLIVNTLVLAFSSISIEFARRQALERAVLAPALSIPGISPGRPAVPWLTISGVSGLAFLAGQALAWRELAHRGLASNAAHAGVFFVVLSAVHALHLFGGLVALLYAAIISLRANTLETRSVVVDITAWYWHVMAALWVYIFAVFALAG